jgi:hypothetical protein
MKQSMPFKEYLRILKGYSNLPLSLNRLTLPFGIISDNKESDFLLVGHILDELQSRLKNHGEAVDCIDVAACAYDLGHDDAEQFLDQAPYLMVSMLKDACVH